MAGKSKCLVAVSALLLTTTLALAADKYGAPVDAGRSISRPAPPSQLERRDGWRERALRSRAEQLPEAFPPQRGTARAVDERGERPDGEESGGGRLRQDEGEGGPD